MCDNDRGAIYTAWLLPRNNNLLNLETEVIIWRFASDKTVVYTVASTAVHNLNLVSIFMILHLKNDVCAEL